jgi:large subunit ribosomal protein L21
MSVKYAIIKTGGKQVRVQQDEVIDVELVGVEPGSPIEFKDVLFVGNGSSFEIGRPLLDGFSVKGEVVEEVAGPKVVSVKYKRSHNQRRKFGHRQRYSRVKITQIGK